MRKSRAVFGVAVFANVFLSTYGSLTARTSNVGFFYGITTFIQYIVFAVALRNVFHFRRNVIVGAYIAVLGFAVFASRLFFTSGGSARTGFALCRGRAATFVSLFVRSVAVRHVIELTARMVVCIYLAVFNAANFTFCFFGTSSRSAFMGFKVYFVAALTFVPVVRSVRRPGRGVRVLMRGLAVLFTADRAYESGRHYEDQTQ